MTPIPCNKNNHGAPINCFVGTGPIRPLDPETNAPDREIISDWWNDQILQYGVKIRYYRYGYPGGYTIDGQNFLYGEYPTAKFENSRDFIALVQIQSENTFLNKFGLGTDADATMVIHISAFQTAYGELSAEPNSGDMVELIEFGSTNRPNGRGAALYEVTKRDDEELGLTNALQGHYVWFINLKRAEYTYQPGLSAEKASYQLNDSKLLGILPGGTQTPTPSADQAYPNDWVDKEAKKIFDYEGTGFDSPYGGY